MTATPWENATDAIFHYASERPDGPAIIDGGITLTYRELATLVGKASVYLKDRGIRAGDRVGVSLANSADHLILSYALLRIGATVIELPLFAKGDPKLAQLIRKFGIGTMFIEFDAEVTAGIASFPLDLGWRRSLDEKSGDWRYAPSDADAALIMLTSGSSGLPKGVIMPHRQLWLRYRARAELMGDLLSAERPGVFLLTNSISYSGFSQVLWCQIFAGGPVVIFPELTRPVDFVRAVTSWKDAVCFATANMCRALISFAPPRGLLLPEIRGLSGMGLPLFAHEKRALVERITPNFYETYGAAGIGAISCLAPTEIFTKSGSVGRPGTANEVEIVDAMGNRVPIGAVGHLRCRGATVLERFYGEDETTVRMEGFRDGWYYPGDLACFDEAGYVYLKGRAFDMITRRGIEIFPPEVEAVLAEHPLVEEAAVVGRPVVGIGEDLVAFVKLRGALSHDDLAAYCMSRLAPEKRPSNIYYVEQMPKTGAGKMDRAGLKSLALTAGSGRPAA